MTRFLKRRRSFDLEAELRAMRVRPRTEFVHSLGQDVRSTRKQTRIGSLRVAFAAGFSALMLVAVAVFGGLGYAAGNSGPVKPGWGCGDKNHIHTGPPGNQYATPPPGCG